MKSKLKTYNFAESPICSRYKFSGNPQNSKDVLKFIEKQINDIFDANTDNTMLKRKLTVNTLNVMGQLFYFSFFVVFWLCWFCLRKHTEKHNINPKKSK